MVKSALVIIDMQLGNFQGSDPVYDGEKLLSTVQRLIGKARDEGVPVFYVQNKGSKGDPDEIGTLGWEIHPTIAPKEGDVVIEKATPDAFHKTTLSQKLRSKGIEKLVIAGLQTEYCIDTTCRRAYSLEYDVVLVKDAHSTWDSSSLTAEQIVGHHNRVLGGWFVTLKNQNEIEF
ncbi:MAG: cysteine hydrolase [Candidatus Bathyarchaeota archaeon]|nr:MAG: cysteine hydrolase [Candidatus Bathyarchaeota archaeon]